MGKLIKKRIEFSRCIASIQVHATGLGYDWILDQCLRSKKEAKWNATHCAVQVEYGRCEENPGAFVHALGAYGHHTFRPIGNERSCHRFGLAADLYLIADGAIDNNPEGYAILGESWKRMHPLARWGGDFGMPDLGHYSFEHKGVR